MAVISLRLPASDEAAADRGQEVGTQNRNLPPR